MNKIDGADLDSEKRAVTEDELESARERQSELLESIDGLRNRLVQAKKWIGLDMDQLRDALSCSLELLGAEPLKPVSGKGPERFEFPDLDPSWASTLDTLRVPPEDGKRSFEWRRQSALFVRGFDSSQKQKLSSCTYPKANNHYFNVIQRVGSKTTLVLFIRLILK